MATTSHTNACAGLRRALLAASLAAAAAVLLPTAGHANGVRSSYGWPVKPFNVQHPVRGLFGDPRVEGSAHQFHFGVDVSAPNGTAVYATLSGVASLLHSDVVVVDAGDGIQFSYWHIVPTVRPGARVVAYRTIIGHVEEPWAHVHFSEARDGRYLNPLRPGAMRPFYDHEPPVVRAIQAEASGNHVSLKAAAKTIDLVVDAYDRPTLVVPPPWSDLPTTPALIRWRITCATGPITSWTTAADFRLTIPAAGEFNAFFARFTRQNHAHRPGRYRIYLTHAWRTSDVPDGRYSIQVVASDIRGNSTRVSSTLIVANRPESRR
jgi:hypothetical protein